MIREKLERELEYAREEAERCTREFRRACKHLATQLDLPDGPSFEASDCESWRELRGRRRVARRWVQSLERLKESEVKGIYMQPGGGTGHIKGKKL